MMSKKIKYGIIAAGWLFIGLTAQAQTLLSLDSCRTMALANNAQAKVAQTQLAKMQYEKNAYLANFFPRISAQGMYLYTTADLGYHRRYDFYDPTLAGLISTLPLPPYILDYIDQAYRNAHFDLDITVKPTNTYMAGVMFEQPLFMGGKITTAYKMARIGQQMAQLNTARSDAEVIFKTDQAYWQYVKVEELHAAALKYREAVQQVCTDAANGVETGMTLENDRLKAQVKLGEANLLVRQAENGRRLAQMNLCATIGLDLFTPIAPRDTLPDTFPALPNAIPDASVRTEYALLKKQLELKRQQVRLTRSDFLPQLGVTGGYNYINGVKLNDTKLFDNASFYAVVSLKIPLSQWYEGSNRVRSAKADVRIAEYQMQETTDLLQMEIVKAYNTLDEAALQTENARNERAQTQENLRISNDRYELGLETLSALLEAQALWQQACSKYIEAKAALRVAESDYLRTVGKLR